MVDHHPQPGASTDGRQRNAQAPSVSASDVGVVVVWLLFSGRCVLVTGNRRRYLAVTEEDRVWFRPGLKNHTLSACRSTYILMRE